MLTSYVFAWRMPCGGRSS